MNQPNHPSSMHILAATQKRARDLPVTAEDFKSP